MSVYRRHKKTNYTCIDNHVFWDHSLSLKAKGLLAQIYSLPDNWEYSIKGLATLFSDGETAVSNAIQELINHGYIVRTQKTNQYGRFDGYEYDIYETPQTQNNITESEKPYSENPVTENPLSDNPYQLNTNILNTNKENTKSISNIPLISPEEKLELLFDDFWKVYPKKVNKKDAFKAFKSIKNIEQLLPDILSDVEMKKNTNDWQRENGRFIPYPGSYLRGERWNDVNEIANLQAYQNELVLQDIQNFNLWRNEDDAQ